MKGRHHIKGTEMAENACYMLSCPSLSPTFITEFCQDLSPSGQRWVVSPLGTITSSQQERLKDTDKGDFLTPSLIKFMLMSSSALLRASDKSFGSSLLFTTSNQDYQTFGQALT